jgi:glycosyltransferase involved in cell wall biosynthesis
MPSERIKVMKFLTYFGVGGTERQFLYLANGLNRTRFDLSIGCMSRSGGFLHDAEALSFPIAEFPAKSLCNRSAWSNQWKLARHLRREKIQVLHAYGFYSTVFAIPPATLGANCVKIVSVRDMGAFVDHARLRTFALSMFCRWADCVLANSHAVRGWLIQQGVKSRKIHVIPNGIGIPPRRTDAEGFPFRDEFKIDHHAPLIAMVARLIRSKGVEYFIEAARGAIDRYPSARFVIVGDNEYLPQHVLALKDRARTLGLGDRMIFTGHRSDVARILREVDVFVLPTLTESFSNSILEAMANGIPVVATNVGGNPELIDDRRTGMLVPPRDAGAIQRALVELLESPSYSLDLGESARDKVIRQFSLAAVLGQTEDLYTPLLDRRGFSAPFAAAA